MFAVEYYNSARREWMPRIRNAGYTREEAETRMAEQKRNEELRGRLTKFRVTVNV